MKPGAHVHFIGMAGIGMSGIARVLLQMGFRVSGSDLRSTSLTRELEAMGAVFFEGHAAENVAGADLVVVSSAIPSTNPELRAAREQGIGVYRRGQMLGYLMHRARGIAVAGTHGKTTTTSMIAMVLERNGLEPTVIIGGELNDIGSNAKLGQGEYLVAEADESDASFLDLAPRIAVVTNVDSDVNLSVPPFAGLEFDYHRTMEKICQLFLEFMHRVPDEGCLVACLDNERLRGLLDRCRQPLCTYGFSSEADVRAIDVECEDFASRSRVLLRGEELGELRLRVPGRHNVQNALAALSVGFALGLGFEAMARVLARFEGAQRRFQIRGPFQGILVVDDYAHNPAKVRAAIHAARTGGARRVVAVFQPHRYTRTRFLAHEFASAFEEADVLLVTDIYPAGEPPIVGVKAETLVEAVRAHGRPAEVYHTPQHGDVLEFVQARCRAGDLVLTLGAGDIGHCAARLADRLGNPHLRRAAI